MPDLENAQGILDVIKSINANGESGQLEITSRGTRGALLFNRGKLVDARLGSLHGFQAINAAASLRDVQFSFDNSVSTPHTSFIAPSERVVLMRFFGIEAANQAEIEDQVDDEVDWDITPEPVVPLAAVDDTPITDVEETPTVEVRPVVRVPFQQQPRSHVALYLVILLASVVGVIALMPRLNAPRQSEQAASTPPAVTVSQPESTIVTSDSPSTVVTAEQRDVKVQDLSGRWNVINTIQKTAYQSFGNMKIGFRLNIKQTGKDFTASGEKFSENGRNLPAGDRTPIRVTGSIDGDKVVATFVEEGAMRKTNGRFAWRLQRDGLAGTFVSNAANSSGKSAATKQP